jgi:hypothetical protein
MNNIKKTISVADAKATLDSLAKIERDTNATVRPPLWLNCVISCCYGMMTFSWAATRDENLWMLGFIISTVGFLLAIALYLYTSRLLGMKPKLTPKSKSEFKFHLLLALFFGMVFALSRMFSTSDLLWAAYLGGIINTLVLAYSLHHYSTGNYLAGKNRHDQC